MKTQVEVTDDIEFLRQLCIERGKDLKELRNLVSELEDELRITKEDLDSCYKSNY